jgi:hypothetical protein
MELSVYDKDLIVGIIVDLREKMADAMKRSSR